jgi:DNA-binding CsgD family transcriptional regulator
MMFIFFLTSKTIVFNAELKHDHRGSGVCLTSPIREDHFHKSPITTNIWIFADQHGHLKSFGQGGAFPSWMRMPFAMANLVGEHGDREVGRITLEGRLFRVMLADAALVAPAICRFDLEGQSLAIIETREQPDPTIEELALRLTSRELEIAALVAHGHANKVIAHRLKISEWTVATYLRRIFLKLDVESRAAMVFRCAPLLQEPLTGFYQRKRASKQSASDRRA